METSTDLIRIYAESVADLKKQIRELQDEKVRLISTNQDVTQTEQKLAEANKMLADVMGKTKKESVALEGSYDAMSKKMAELKKEYHATADAMRRAELAPQIKSLNDSLSAMDKAVGQYGRNVGNYASALSGIKQAGGDFSNGLMAMSGIMGLTANQTDELKNSMATFNAVLGIAQSGKGILGLIKQIGEWVKGEKTAKTVTDALTASENANTVATGAATTATATFGTVLKTALPILGLVATAIALLVTYWEDISNAVSKFLGIQKQEEEGTLKLTEANDKLNEKFEDQNHELENRVKLGKAQGKSEKELLLLKKETIKAQQEETKKVIETVQARIAEIQTHSWLQRLFKGENAERKKLEKQLEELQKTMKKLDQTSVDIDVDIQVADLEAGKKGKANADKLSAELKKAAEEARKEVQEILEKELTAEQKAVKASEKIQEKLKKLQENEIKEVEDRVKRGILTTENGELAKAEIKERYARAEIISTRDLYKTLFNLEYQRYKTEHDLVDREITEKRELYGELKATLKGNAMAQYELNEQVKNDTINSLKGTANGVFRILRETIGPDMEETVDEWQNMWNTAPQHFLALYNELLTDETEFMQKYKEPLTTAMKTLGPTLLDITTTERQALKNRVDTLMQAIEEAMDKQKVGDVNLLFKQLIGDPPIADDPTLVAVAHDFAKRMRTIFAKEVYESDTDQQGFRMGWKQKYSMLEQILFGDPYEVPEHAKEMLAKMKWKMMTDDIVYYSEIATNAINNVASAWMSTITARQNALKHELEINKISQKEYEEQARKKDKQMEAEFNAMKAFQISTAVISTASGIMQVWADPTGGPWYVKLANSIALAGEGAAQIATIASTYYNRMSSLSAPTMATAPATVQTAGLSEYAEAIGGTQNLNVSVGIVDSELKTALDKYDQKQDEVSF